MNFNDEVDWPQVFGEHIHRPSLADPHNPDRAVYVKTMVILEAALKEVEEQLSGRSKHSRDDFASARLTREIVLKRAARIAAKLPEPVSVNEGVFKDRWRGPGGMANFFVCVVRYVCTAPRWSKFLSYGPRIASKLLPRVQAGELTLADLISRIAAHDLRMRTRLAKYWLFQLSLTIDAKWQDVAKKAYAQLLDAYSEQWVPVYEQGLATLGVKFRPDMTAKELGTIISAQTSGFAQHLAGTGDESAFNCRSFAKSVQMLIHSALDVGDGHTVADALNNAVR